MPINKKEGKASEEKKDSKKILIFLALIIVLLLIIVVLLVKGYLENEISGNSADDQNGNREVAGSTRMVLDEETAGSVYEEMRKDVEEGMFECSMSMTWTFEDGGSESKDAIVLNSSNNSHPFYFDVTLENDDEILYSSPVLPVGTQLTNIKLDRPLEAGTYRAVCKYTLLKDEESQEEISSAGFIITIVIQR